MDSITLTDVFLQRAKKLERAWHARGYRVLAEDLRAFERPEFRYPSLPELGLTPNILIFKPDDIGDAVYALPAIARLRESLPSAKIFLICQKKTAPVFESSMLIDKIVSVGVQAHLIRFQSLDLEGALAQFGGTTFDAAVFLRSYPAFFSSFKKIPALVKIHPKDPRFPSDSPFQAFVSLWGERRAHQAEQMLQIVGRITGKRYQTGDVNWPQFHWNDIDREAIEKSFDSEARDYVVLHPFARFETRRYPYDYWRRLLAMLQNASPYRWVIIGGKEDPVLGIPGVTEMQGKLSLSETGYLISKSRAFIGNESGPGHWAAALRKPVITILSGHSHVSEWGVWGDKALNLRLSVPCENCYLRACPLYKVRCLTEMTPESIAPQIISYLKNA